MSSKIDSAQDVAKHRLPDDILCYILSTFPTRDVVRAGLVTPKCKNLWASVPTIDIDDAFLSKFQAKSKGKQQEVERSFVNFVTNMINRDNIPFIPKLRLSCTRTSAKVFVSWVNDACKRDVRHVELSFYQDQVVLPKSLFMLTSLVELKLETDYLVIPDTVSLPNLKSLHLNVLLYAKDWDLKGVLLSGCPALEKLLIRASYEHKLFSTSKRDKQVVFDSSGKVKKNLVINEWRVNKKVALDISIPTLKHFEMEFVAEDVRNLNVFTPGKLEINAPNLEYLSIRDYHTSMFSIIDLGSLVKARVDCQNKYSGTVNNDDYYGQIFQLVEGITSVKSLSLSSHVTLALNSVMNTMGIDLPTYDNLMFLELGVDGDSGCQFLPQFLNSVPNLKFLVLVYKGDDNLCQGEVDWTTPEHIPSCLRTSLEEITVEGFYADSRFEAVEYMLQHSVVLKKLKVKYDHADKESAHKFFEHISRVPRSSATCETILVH